MLMRLSFLKIKAHHFPTSDHSKKLVIICLFISSHGLNDVQIWHLAFLLVLNALSRKKIMINLTETQVLPLFTLFSFVHIA